MDVKYLNYILTIAQHRNMTKAARDLYVSQSSLSQYLTKLERELGTPLFYRSKGELTLTPAGELYVEAARKVVAIKDDLYNEIAALASDNDPKSCIRVGVTSNWALRMIDEIIPLYAASYPTVNIQISELGLPALRKALVDGDIEVGLAADTSTEIYDGNADILRKEEVLLAVPKTHTFVRTHDTSIGITSQDIRDNFQDSFFLLSKKGSSIRYLSDDYFDSFGFKPRANVETNNVSSTNRMVSQGTGIAFIAESCSWQRDRIAYYSVIPSMYRLNLAIHRKNWEIGESEQAFMDLLLGYFKNNTENPYIA